VGVDATVTEAGSDLFIELRDYAGDAHRELAADARSAVSEYVSATIAQMGFTIEKDGPAAIAHIASNFWHVFRDCYDGRRGGSNEDLIVAMGRI
jgi:hypothetical protein